MVSEQSFQEINLYHDHHQGALVVHIYVVDDVVGHLGVGVVGVFQVPL